jgi:hypothetical protein
MLLSAQANGSWTAHALLPYLARHVCPLVLSLRELVQSPTSRLGPKSDPERLHYCTADL